MEGVTDFPFRIWISLASAPDYLCTPFLRATETFPAAELPEGFCPELFVPGVAAGIAYQVIPQVMAKCPEDFIRAAELMLPSTAFVDLNCGCPAPKAVGKGAGSSLLADVDLFAGFLAKLRSALGKERFSIKMRTGYDNTGAFGQLIGVLAEVRPRRLTVHGRTKNDGYSGLARWDLIAAAAAAVSVPVVGSGDIAGVADLIRARGGVPELAAVIVGRGALRNPWVFQELRTGEMVRMPLQTLSPALETFALLHHFHETDGPGLRQMAAEGHLMRDLGTGSEAWESFLDFLKAAMRRASSRPGSPPYTEGEVSRGALGRTKLLWNHMRGSLPDIFSEPRLFRETSLPGFLRGLQSLQQDAALSAPDGTFALGENAARSAT